MKMYKTQKYRKWVERGVILGSIFFIILIIIFKFGHMSSIDYYEDYGFVIGQLIMSVLFLLITLGVMGMVFVLSYGLPHIFAERILFANYTYNSEILIDKEKLSIIKKNKGTENYKINNITKFGGFRYGRRYGVPSNAGRVVMAVNSYISKDVDAVHITLKNGREIRFFLEDRNDGIKVLNNLNKVIKRAGKKITSEKVYLPRSGTVYHVCKKK